MTARCLRGVKGHPWNLCEARFAYSHKSHDGEDPMTNYIPKTNLPPNPARKTKGNPPTHKLYRVIRGRGNLDKDVWTEIAACWPHADGNGFKVKFKSNETPVAGAEYVMRRDSRWAE